MIGVPPASGGRLLFRKGKDLMVPESVLYTAYVLLIGLGATVCVSMIVGLFIIGKVVKKFLDLEKKDKEVQAQDGAAA